MEGSMITVVDDYSADLRDCQCDPSFNRLFNNIYGNYISLGKEEARAILEQPINTKGLVIHTENEIEGENENGNKQRTDEAL